MLCRVCEENKLSKEFVFKNFSEKCEHPALFCMRCGMKAVYSTKLCPFPGCSEKVSPSVETLREYEAILNSMFPGQDGGGEGAEEEPAVAGATGEAATVTVVLLTGEAHYFTFTRNTTVLDLKRKITSTLNIPREKQKLLYNEVMLEDYKENGGMYKLADYSVLNGSKIYLLVILYSVPKTFNDVIFDLYWNYPVSGADFLDASCLAFSGPSHVAICDYSYSRRCQLNNSVLHSGDVMDDQQRRGHHTIEVKLQQIPPKISHLVFTLSAWGSPTIRHFPNPSLKFFEASNRMKDLCSTSFMHAVHSQAVVMCSVVRNSSGGWEIYRSGALSAGNAIEYQPIIQTIQGLIKSGM